MKEVCSLEQVLLLRQSSILIASFYSSAEKTPSIFGDVSTAEEGAIRGGIEAAGDLLRGNEPGRAEEAGVGLDHGLAER